MRRSFQVVLVGLLAATGAVGAQEASQAFLVCYPNAPGTTETARPVMARLGEYLTARAPGTYRPTYFNAVDPAREYVRAQRPRFAILSLDLYLRWREEMGLVPLASTVRGGRTAERYTLLVAKDSPHQRLEDLTRLGRPARLWSSHLDDRRFAARVVLAGKLDLEGDDAQARVVSTDQPLRALRRLKKGEPFRGEPVDAVLVDATTWAGLQKLRSFAGVLRVLYTSPPLPTPPLVAFGATPAAEQERVRKVVCDMSDDPQAKALLDTLQLSGFRPADAEALRAAQEAYAGGGS